MLLKMPDFEFKFFVDMGRCFEFRTLKERETMIKDGQLLNPYANRNRIAFVVSDKTTKDLSIIVMSHLRAYQKATFKDLNSWSVQKYPLAESFKELIPEVPVKEAWLGDEDSLGDGTPTIFIRTMEHIAYCNKTF